MSAAVAEMSPAWSQDNVWRGPTASSTITTSMAKSRASNIRTIKRKPVPEIPSELLQQATSSSIATAATSTASTSAAKAIQPVTITDADADTTLTQESTRSLPPSAPTTQRPQRQYLLEIDAPAASQDTNCAADDSVRQLLRSATVSASSASSRPRKGPLKWVQDKQEHAATASSSSSSNLSPPRQPTLSRKTSISAHLRMTLRRNKNEEQPCSGLNISGPTNFVHISTGTEGARNVHGAPSSSSLRRSSTTSHRSSVCSSVSSVTSAVSFDTAESGSAAEHSASEDKPLYAASERKHPLRPLRSIRRPSKLSMDQKEPVLNLPNGPTSPKDKRKGIYAAVGSVPKVLEAVDTSTHVTSSPLKPPATSRAGEHFAAALDRSIGRARGQSSDGGELSPEPELSRSPCSGYESSTCTSNRSSLGSLQEFRTFLDFSEMLPASRRGSAKGGDDLWSAPALAVPIVLDKF